MKLKTVEYDYSMITTDKSIEKNFKNAINVSNIIYLFYKDTECLYIGETGTSLKDRWYRHTPKELDEEWVKQGNKIHIIELDEVVDNIARQALESSFILAYRPEYNKKA